MRKLCSITEQDLLGTGGLSAAEPRIAVRAVLLDAKGRMALIHVSKYAFDTMPGGGVEPGETLEQALLRELLEETGCHAHIDCALGYVEENRFSHDFTQRSHYYLARVVGEKGEPALTQEEAEEGTLLSWVTPTEALRLVRAPRHEVLQRMCIQARDIAVLEEALRVLAGPTQGGQRG